MTTSPRAFISFDFDHNETEKHLFAGQAKNSRTPFNIQDWSSKASLPQSQWERIIEEKISKSNMVIVLVGKYTHLALGVSKEISFARKNNVPVFGVYVGGAHKLSPIPMSIPRGRIISWDWNQIANGIDLMMKEGKNKQ